MGGIRPADALRPRKGPLRILASMALRATMLLWRGQAHQFLFQARVNGLSRCRDLVRHHIRIWNHRQGYGEWVRQYDTASPRQRARIERFIARLARRPLISLIVAITDETEAARLPATIAALRNQPYGAWRLSVVADGGVTGLEPLGAADECVAVTTLPPGTSRPSLIQTGMASAAGEFVVMLGAGDLPAETALALVAGELAAHPDANLIYGDDDELDAAGRRQAPRFKPDWSPDLLLGTEYVGPCFYRRDLIERIGGVRSDFGAQWAYDLILRASAASAPTRIRHVPAILFHRASPSKAADAADARRCVEEHLQRHQAPARVAATADGHRVVWDLPDPAPLVSLLVPTRDRVDLLRGCIDGLLRRTDYPALEVLVLDNDSREPETLAYFAEIEADPRVRVLRCPGPFNFAAVNNAGVAAARGTLVGFVNNDIEVIDGGWLREMAAQACRPEVGAVGAKLLYGDGTVQHGGVILGIGGIGDHAHKFFPGDHPGYLERLRHVQEFSAVTAACLVMRKAVFAEVGGFDADNLAVAFNDVDLCLKVGARGYRVLWTPHATLYHLESASRGSDMARDKAERFLRENQYMRRRWGAVIDADPFYNPNLCVFDCDFSLAFPPRRRHPWRG